MRDAAPPIFKIDLGGDRRRLDEFEELNSDSSILCSEMGDTHPSPAWTENVASPVPRVRPKGRHLGLSEHLQIKHGLVQGHGRLKIANSDADMINLCHDDPVLSLSASSPRDTPASPLRALGVVQGLGPDKSNAD